ncbi:MAG: hypothetical protein HQL18_00380 [Candidatus Omnitrophica bacterium]|nr:hypothetical protein [Candidatus Omnitrophota bacterium]
MTTYPKDYLQRTINLFQPHSDTPLTLEDAREIADNALDLFEYLIELKQQREGGHAEIQQPESRL